VIDHELAYYTRPDGVTIAYATAGQGPPLVVVPGWTTHISWWFREPATLLVEPLTRHFQLIVYDKHGHGLSDRDRTEFTLETERYDIEALVDHLGLDTFDLFGLSEGGAVAMSYAAAFPERVEKLALYSTFANGPSVASSEFQSSLAAIVRASWGVGSKVIADMLIPGASTEEQQEFAAAQREGATHFPPTPGDPNTIDAVNELLGFLADGARAEAVADQASFRTIVFTDVESSTELTARMGDAAGRDVLRQHERLTREAVGSHGGTEIKTMGDGFMVSFASASAALDTAIDLQRSISDFFADSDVPIRVRVGMDAGEPIAEGDDLHGTAVIRAARIMGEAAGGQILVSGLVRELVAGRDYGFTNRGHRDLKGFDAPVLLHELHWEPGRISSNSAEAAEGLRHQIGVGSDPGAWLEITQERVDEFADVTHDRQWIHVDPERAKAETPLGGTIAHGFLTLSLLTHLLDSVPAATPREEGLTAIINYGLGKVRFVNPVPVGSRIRAARVVSDVEVKATAVELTQTVDRRDRGSGEAGVGGGVNRPLRPRHLTHRAFGLGRCAVIRRKSATDGGGVRPGAGSPH
jgi:class 3 adenylate cyclase/acyl dehydratase